MVYNNGLVGVIKVGNKVLRESNSQVFLPFGSEYKICLKNKTNQKALVSIYIDGESIGPALILYSYSSIDLERFTKDSLEKGKRFKFIEKTSQISDFRGDRIDDGLVEIRYDFEQQDYRIRNPYRDIFIDDPNPWNIPKWGPQYTYTENTPMFSCNINDSSVVSNSVPRCVDGITTEGSISNQSFRLGEIGRLEGNLRTIIFHLRGEIKGQDVVEEITTRTKSRCAVCGNYNKFNDKFCSNCGTNLENL